MGDVPCCDRGSVGPCPGLRMGSLEGVGGGSMGGGRCLFLAERRRLGRFCWDLRKRELEQKTRRDPAFTGARSAPLRMSHVPERTGRRGEDGGEVPRGESGDCSAPPCGVFVGKSCVVLLGRVGRGPCTTACQGAATSATTAWGRGDVFAVRRGRGFCGAGDTRYCEYACGRETRRSFPCLRRWYRRMGPGGGPAAEWCRAVAAVAAVYLVFRRRGRWCV